MLFAFQTEKTMRPLLLTFFCWLGITISHADTHPPFNNRTLEQQVHQQINVQRHKYGLPTLSSDPRLVIIARNHSIDMASNHFFSHYNPAGEDSSARAKRQGWNLRKQLDARTYASGVAENIFMSHLYDKIITTTRNGIPVKRQYSWQSQHQIVDSIVQGWMHSPSHRDAILSPQYDRQGIGIAMTADEIFVTENFF